MRYRIDPKMNKAITTEKTSTAKRSALAGFLSVTIPISAATEKQNKTYHRGGISTIFFLGSDVMKRSS
jgi:hypothetical protein